jgi:hypothetical protein
VLQCARCDSRPVGKALSAAAGGRQGATAGFRSASVARDLGLRSGRACNRARRSQRNTARSGVACRRSRCARWLSVIAESGEADPGVCRLLRGEGLGRSRAHRRCRQHRLAARWCRRGRGACRRWSDGRNARTNGEHQAQPLHLISHLIGDAPSTLSERAPRLDIVRRLHRLRSPSPLPTCSAEPTKPAARMPLWRRAARALRSIRAAARRSSGLSVRVGRAQSR